MSYFDSLVHATSDGTWLGGTRYDASLSRLLREMDVAAVERACLVGIANYTNNDDVLEFSTRYSDRLLAIAGVNPVGFETESQMRAEIERHQSRGFRGIKLHPRLNCYDPLHPNCLAAVRVAGACGLVVFLDTLFRQPSRALANPVDSIDKIVKDSGGTRIVLLHSAGPSMMELFELGRMHDNILLDLSFSIMRYAGSSLDMDMRFLMEKLDQRVIVGSDFPEYTPSETKARVEMLSVGITPEKQRAFCYENLQKLFS